MWPVVSLKVCLIFVLILSCMRTIFHGVPIQDQRVQYVLHSMPAETQILTVVSAPNTVFDQQIFQCPDPETIFQLFAAGCAWSLYEQIHQQDVTLIVGCTLRPEGSENRYPSSSFIFMTPNAVRDRQINGALRNKALSGFSYKGKIVYELDRSLYFCMPIPGILICTNTKSLMRIIVSRSDAWWLNRVALPGTLSEWNFVNQNAPYWGLRHFASMDPSSPTHKSDGTLRDSQAKGLTYQFTDNYHDLYLTYVSDNADIKNLAPKLVKDVDPRLCHPTDVEIIDHKAARVRVFDSRIITCAAYSIQEWFEPRFGLEVEAMRRAHHREHSGPS